MATNSNSQPNLNQSKETIISNPVPDSEKPEFKDDLSRYDFDFQVAPKPSMKKEEQNIPEPDPKPEPEPEPTPEPEPEPSEPDAGEKKEGGDEPVPELKEPEKSTPDIQAKDTEISTLKGENDTLKKEIQSLQAIKAAIDEIQKAPEVFIKKHFPSLAPQVSPYKMIADRLKQDPRFGADFRFEPSEAWMEGTPSYEYRLREEEMKDEYRREITRIDAQRIEAETTQARKMEEDKSKIMKDFNLNEQQFQKEIVDWAKKQPLSLYDVAKLRYADDLVKRAVAKALAESKGRKVDIQGQPKAGAKDIHGSGEGQPEHLKEWDTDFGEKL